MSDLSQIPTEELLRMLQGGPALPSAAQRVAGDPISQGALHPERSGGGTVQFGPLDTGIKTSEDVENFLAGTGRGLTRLGQGAAQGLGFGPTNKEVTEQEDRDVPLMATKAGFGGDIFGTSLPLLPVGVLPKAGSAVGAAAIGGGLGFAQPLGEGDEEMRGMNTLLGAGSALAVRGGTNYLSEALRGRAAQGAAQAASKNARAQELAKVLSASRKEGFVTPPSQVNPSIKNKMMESIAGKAATGQEASLRNQDVAYALAQRTAGLGPGESMNEVTLSKAREVAAEPYRRIASLSPEAKVMLDEWKRVNLESKLQWNFYKRSGDPAAYKAAEAADRASKLALDQIDDIATKTKSGANLVQKLKDARVQIAKIHQVERGMEGASVDPQEFVKMLNRGEKLSGDLRTIADFAQNFPKAMKAPQVGGGPGVNQLLPWLGVGGGSALGAVLGGPAGAGLGGMAGIAATQAVPPAIRSMLLSRALQSKLAPPTAGTPMSQALIEALQRYPALRQAMPAAAALGVTQ